MPLTLHRAHAVFTIKSVADDARVITGMASTPEPDRQGDIMEPLGAQFDLPLPLLWQHDSRQPVGEVFAAKATATGIEVQARFAQAPDPGPLQQRLDDAWQQVKLKLVRGLSIGFQSIEEARIKDGFGYHYLKWAWLELSAVTVPANADATIQVIKSLDVGLAASGTEAAPAPQKPAGVSAPSRVVKAMRLQDRSMKKSFADQIATWEATRAAKTARMDELLSKGGDTGLTMDATEQEEHDGLEGEVKGIDAQLVRLRAAEDRAKAAAKPVEGTDEEKGAKSRAPHHNVITVEKKLPPGFGFARLVICEAQGLLQRRNPVELAKQVYPDDTALQTALRVKAAIGAGATVTQHWADDLVPYNILMTDFIEFLRPGSILGKMGGPNPGGGPDYPSLRRVPFNVRVSGASAGLTGRWVGEGLPVPISKMTTFAQALTWAKVEALAVLTQEEMRFSNPSAEQIVRNDLARAVNARLDVDFVDPALAAVPNVSPASITYGVAATPPSGTTAAAARTDLATMLALFATNNLDPADIVLIMSAQMALQFSMMVNALGNNDFPDVSMKGGVLRGFPVIVSEHLTSVGSPATQTIVAVKTGDVYLADDGVVSIDATVEASLEMLDSNLVQNGLTGAGTSLVSLWQAGLMGLKAQREITWQMRRPTAVQYIAPAAYKA